MMGSAIDTYDPSEAIRAAMRADSRVQAVVLVGSRAAGTATELSDWDYLIVSAAPGAIALQLPDLVAELNPLAQLWDPLASTPVYMITLPGAVKADLSSARPVARPIESPDPHRTLRMYSLGSSGLLSVLDRVGI